jgi:predicted ATP-grasp superfamily ATP-dependent carboligase
VDSGENLLIFGASARAAAFSALRAGLRPWCADLFADADLRARCPALRLPGRYPHGFLELIETAPPGPWTYGGGLENWPTLVERMAQRRPLWGNDGPALKRARSPRFVAKTLRAAGLPAPAIQWRDWRGAPGRWLVKPVAGAGGRGIHFWDGQPRRSSPASRREYLQEFIDGEPRAAVYVGDGRTAQFLGLTRQLVGECWLSAAPFHYCGSIGPLELTAGELRAFEKLGNVVAAACSLRGLFGIDGVAREEVFWPVEINPRYTSSVEVLEYATGLPAFAWHRQTFDPSTPPPSSEPQANGCVGKAILFARTNLVFPAFGPWSDLPRASGSVAEMPLFADIPQAGESIRAGKPILTSFVRADTAGDCYQALRDVVEGLESALFARRQSTAKPE